jgi:aminoglycoside phosphotransferase family enzyme/predicted kinase
MRKAGPGGPRTRDNPGRSLAPDRVPPDEISGLACRESRGRRKRHFTLRARRKSAMTTTSRLDDILRAMTQPAFYPHGVSAIEIRHTHISAVVLTGRWVYKLKKPRDLGFLDFRTLADRLRFCSREVELNRRLSSDVYDGVVAIREDAGGRLSLGPDGTVVEYVVRMRQLPDEANLARLLAAGEFGADRLEALGRALAGFHAAARRSPEADAFGDPEVIRFNMEENFEQIAPFVDGLMDGERWDFIRQVCRAFHGDRQELFRHRVRSGRVGDGHGDLRADHVYLDRGIQIIDCIEFNDRFRYGDAALDLAFLKMDLDRLGFAEAARGLVSAYARAAADPGLYALLDFYAAYRALVRLKVACLSMDQTDLPGREHLLRDVRTYLHLAFRYAMAFGRPTLWIFCGLPASGKSTLAEKTAAALDMPVLSSDTLRKQDSPGATVSPFNAGPYRPVLRGRVYARLLNLAQERLRQGASVALDATFTEARWRRAAGDLAADLGAYLVFVHCACSTDTLRERLAAREGSCVASDARLAHLDDMLKNFEAFGREPRDACLSIDTDTDLETCLYETISGAAALRDRQLDKLESALRGSDGNATGARATRDVVSTSS